MAEILSKKQKFGIHLQTDWATVGTASTNYETLWYDAEVSNFDNGNINEQFNYSSASGLHPELNRNNIDTGTGIKMLNFQGVADARGLAHHFAAAFQTVSEAATTPYLKTYTPTQSVIDFNGDGGYVYTLAMGNYDNGSNAGDGKLLKQAILNDFTLSFQNDAQGIGRAGRISGTWYGTSSNADQYLSGTWTNTTKPASVLGLGSLDDLDLTIYWDSETYALTDGCWASFSLTYNNNAQPHCIYQGGISQWRIAPTMTFTIELWKTDATYKLFGDYAAGTLGYFNLNNGAGTSANEIIIAPTTGTCRLDEQPEGYNNGYDTIRLTGTILADASGNFSNFLKWADGTDRSF